MIVSMIMTMPIRILSIKQTVRAADVVSKLPGVLVYIGPGLPSSIAQMTQKQIKEMAISMAITKATQAPVDP